MFILTFLIDFVLGALSIVGVYVLIYRKDFYTSSEVEELCKKAMQQGDRNEGCTALYESFEDWFERNKKKERMLISLE